MKRRSFLKTLAAGASLPFAAGNPLPAAEAPPRTSMGVAPASFSDKTYTRPAYNFLEYCSSLGAGGVQVMLDSVDPDYLDKLRRRCSELGMYLEVSVRFPRTADTTDFEQRVAAARQAGALCVQSACGGGRRYEVFSSLDQWKDFNAAADKTLAQLVPILEKYRMPLGLENHKNWTADEMVAVMERHASEYLGVCLDIGNNIALLDDSLDAVRKLAPYAVTSHFKDMAAKEYSQGFLLSEVPLGHGASNLPAMVDVIRKARPQTRLNLEMITRDPLQVPCLTDKYWVTFPDRSGLYLAHALSMVRDHPPREPLPQVSGLDPVARRQQDEANVKLSLAYAGEKLGLLL
jgi:sugar phosphate isomerase/epimerase